MNWVGELAEELNRTASPQRLVGEDYVGFEDSLPTPQSFCDRFDRLRAEKISGLPGTDKLLERAAPSLSTFCST
jgi:hypothetical protein